MNTFKLLKCAVVAIVSTLCFRLRAQVEITTKAEARAAWKVFPAQILNSEDELICINE
jgi:hypothetical protein